MPYFLCASVRKICEKCGIEFELYHIDDNFNPILTDITSDSYVYIVNYYGQKSEADILLYKKQYENIIVDNAQNFFAEPVCGTDTLYTCRKYFGVPDGGYLYTDSVIKGDLKTDISYQRIEFILGRYELDAPTFYKQASNNNKFFENEELKGMSKLTQNLLRGIDYNSVIRRRNENFELLHSKLENKNKLKLITPNGPFMYPLLLENGEKVKKMLIEKKIFVPTLWPEVSCVCKSDSIESYYSKNIVPLPVDQRYGIAEMKYIVEVLNNVLSERN